MIVILGFALIMIAARSKGSALRGLLRDSLHGGGPAPLGKLAQIGEMVFQTFEGTFSQPGCPG